MKKLFLLFALFLAACAPQSGTAPQQSCALFKIAAGKILADGQYKSQFLTRKVGTIAYLLIEIKHDSARAWVIDAYSRAATPATGAEAFLPWSYDGAYMHLDGFMPMLTVTDTLTFRLSWQDSDFDMTWRKPLDTPLGVYIDPHPPQAPTGCKE